MQGWNRKILRVQILISPRSRLLAVDMPLLSSKCPRMRASNRGIRESETPESRRPDCGLTGCGSLELTVCMQLFTIGKEPDMRWSKTFIPTLRDNPADAEFPSHQLLIRGGLHPPARRRNLLVSSAGAAHDAQDHEHHPRGAGRCRRAGVFPARASSGGSLAGNRTMDRHGRNHVSPEGPRRTAISASA